MKLFWLVALLLAGAVITACGDDASDSSGGATDLACSAGDEPCLTRAAASPSMPATTPTVSFPATATALTAATVAASQTLAAPSVTPDPSAAESGISGIVLIGPQCPVVMEGEECPDAPYEAIIGIRDAAGQAVASVASGADGRFRVVLPPGTYTLVARPPTSTPIPAPVEMTVVVEASRFTDIVVSMDSGIR